MNKPTSGKQFLEMFKDHSSVAKMCAALGVPYKLAHNGYPLKETIDGIIEQLIHQIIYRDVAINDLVAKLRYEMNETKYPKMDAKQWEVYKYFETED